MNYLLDTANLRDIRYYSGIFPIKGVTTNPSIVKKEGKIDFFSHMNEIRSVIGEDKPLHIQVTALDTDGMLKDADTMLDKIDDNVFVKVPVTMEGIKAVKILKSQKIKVTATAVYSRQQGYLSMEAGADYIAPYFNRMEHIGVDSYDVISSLADMIRLYDYPTQILAASFKNAGQVDRAFKAGSHTATVEPSILESALMQPHIISAVEAFDTDWKSVFGDRTIAQL